MSKTDTPQELHFKIYNSLDAVAKTTQEIYNILIEKNITDAENAQSIQLALIEILTNAVEHGNLEIDSQQKINLLNNYDDSYYLYLEKRNSETPYKDRNVSLDIEIYPDKMAFIIVDEGPGFDHKKLLETIRQNSDDQFSKRGILLTMGKCIDEIYYNEKGNKATLIKKL